MPSQQIEPFEAIAIWKSENGDPVSFNSIHPCKKVKRINKFWFPPQQIQGPSPQSSYCEIQTKCRRDWDLNLSRNIIIHHPKMSKKLRKIEKIPLKVKVWWWNMAKVLFLFLLTTWPCRIFHTSWVLMQSLSQIRAPPNFCCGFCADVLSTVIPTWFMASQQQHWQKGEKNKNKTLKCYNLWQVVIIKITWVWNGLLRNTRHLFFLLLLILFLWLFHPRARPFQTFFWCVSLGEREKPFVSFCFWEDGPVE